MRNHAVLIPSLFLVSIAATASRAAAQDREVKPDRSQSVETKAETKARKGEIKAEVKADKAAAKSEGKADKGRIKLKAKEGA
jgi:hypothetical protein